MIFLVRGSGTLKSSKDIKQHTQAYSILFL